jgi:lysozyme family protein
MRATFDAYFPELLKHEGGYVDHPSDPGGATNLGITIGTLRQWRDRPVTKADVRALTRKEAAAIYRKNYWDAIGGDDLPEGLDALAFDIAVNHGVGRWRQWAPVAKGLDADDAIRAVTARRRKFYRSLKTFSTFGKGWMRRADEVERWALRRATQKLADKPAEKPATREQPFPAPAKPEPPAVETGKAEVVSEAKPKDIDAIIRQGTAAAAGASAWAALFAGMDRWIVLGLIGAGTVICLYALYVRAWKKP